MLYLFFWLVLAHLLADFYLQSDRMVQAKQFTQGGVSGAGAHLLHVLIHGVLVLLALYGWAVTAGVVVDAAISVLFSATLLLMGLHLLTDVLKSGLTVRKPGGDFIAFVLDQLVHLVVLAGIVYGVLQPRLFVPLPPAPHPDKTLIADVILLVSALMFLLRPSSILVSKFLEMAMNDTRMGYISMTQSQLREIFDEGIRSKMTKLLAKAGRISAGQVDKVLADSQYNNRLIAGQLNQIDPGTDVSQNFPSNQAGKWIGYIERVMIFIFFIVGQYTAIAAVMAIKTAFRFNDLKDDTDSHRSEYIMIGTFSSFFITMLVAVLVQHLLRAHDFSHAASQWLSNIL